ncbi:DUF4179 domain-containing protein [Paenibacillus sp. WLX1005]|uniref:DUF4179 domain-containing protein n=1 Tax=Paenibacillus sp. WLX1005 TaxID=3243766 RepID=UPI0039840EB7
MRTDKLEEMLKQIGEQEVIEQKDTEIPVDIQVELRSIYQAIGQGQSADQIRQTISSTENASELQQQQEIAEKKIASIPPIMATENPNHRRNRRLIRYGITAAAVMFIGIGSAISSAFFSADMARAIKQLPGANQLYQLTSQWGWMTADEQEVKSPQLSVEQDGITLTLHSLLYDGKKVRITLEQYAAKKQHGIQQVEIYVNGRQVSSPYNKINEDSVQDDHTSIYDLQRELIPEALLGITQQQLYETFESYDDIPISKMPENVNMQIKITLQGMTNQPFVYDVNTERSPLPNYTLSNTLQIPEGMSYHSALVQATPIITYIQLNVSYLEQWEKWRYRYYLQHGNYPASITYGLSDSNNRVYRIQSHSGTYGDNPSEFLEFDPIIGTPKELILTPFMFNEEPITHHRPVPLHSQGNINLPITLDMGTTGKVKLLEVNSTSDQYILRFQPEQSYQTYTTATSLWYGNLNQRHGVYSRKISEDPNHQGQFLMAFDKSDLKQGDQLYYSIDKIRYMDTLHLQATQQ